MYSFFQERPEPITPSFFGTKRFLRLPIKTFLISPWRDTMCRGWLRIAVVHVPAAPISEAAIPIPWALRTVLSPAKSQRQHITEWEWARQIVAKGFAPELA